MRGDIFRPEDPPFGIGVHDYGESVLVVVPTVGRKLISKRLFRLYSARERMFNGNLEQIVSSKSFWQFLCEQT